MRRLTAFEEPTPTKLLMDRFPAHIPWRVALEADGNCYGEVAGERSGPYEIWTDALDWVAQRLGVVIQ